MKQNRLSSSIIAGIVLAAGYAGGAQAVHLNQRGTGEVLLYPYYTVQGGNQTLLSLVNTTAAGKAVNVRFREGMNSRSVVEFHVYMAPFDTWTASVFSLSDAGTSNPANLVTSDNTCTAPRIKNNTSLPALTNGNRYVPFLNYAYTGTNDDAGPDTLDRTREGHIEMIEMGEVVDRSRGSLTAITTGTGTPANCGQVVSAWLPAAAGALAYWTLDASTDMNPPQGGLFGSALIVDALQGTMMSYQADAVDDFSDVVQHTAPGIGLPTLTSARNSSTAATAQVFVDGALVSSSYPLSQAIDAVSALFVQDQMYNEFATGVSVGGASEWVVSFPTKFAYTDQAAVGSVALLPFTQTFPTVATQTNSGTADVHVLMAARNREARPVAGQAPPLDFPGKLGFATNVLAFSQHNTLTNGSSILGSRLAKEVDIQGMDLTGDGWATLSLYSATAPSGSLIDQQRMRADLAGGRWSGLPVHGFWAVSYTNGQLTPGVLSNYGDIVKHRGSADYQAAP
jgi:hypothetical protein